ncbi:hypothetical protein SAMN05444170_2430 [Bradyrhizobium erythrophlei]|jgi:hypothetical protein|uniref:Uncharacterized protein n=1 Tax=Bradyrhizobium erythrophlei TaxID=1437360 RepID=A0A1M7TR67_9BRAD|nr:hypothetical protein SAMN05444170_2430 [Bradyrhizobium erythrophlei]
MSSVARTKSVAKFGKGVGGRGTIIIESMDVRLRPDADTSGPQLADLKIDDRMEVDFKDRYTYRGYSSS